MNPPAVDNGSPDSGGGDGDAGADAGDEASQEGDAATDAAGGDDLVYIYQRDGEAEAVEMRGGVDGGREVAEVEAEIVSAEDRRVESYAESAALALARDMEFLLQAVQEDREVLEQSLARLREEYMLRDASAWTGLRGLLSGLFESGNRERDAVNRVIGEMRRQMDEYRVMPGDRRDGMVTESLRELIDGAARRSGETGALSRALDAVVRLLSDSRTKGSPPPSEAELAAAFEASLSAARAAWHAKAALSDPMGRELATAQAGN